MKFAQTPDTDPQSSLMSDAAVCRFLGIDSVKLNQLIRQQRLTRRPITGSFLRKQVQQVHDEAVGEPPRQDEKYRTELNLR